MATTLRIKRRSAAGATGAPSALKNGELAYSEKDNALYYGFGDDGSGNATSIPAIAGPGLYLKADFSNPSAVLGVANGGTGVNASSTTANYVFAAPNGSAGSPTFRLLVAADIPSLTAAKISDFDTQVRTSRLDQMAAPTAAVAFNTQRITNLAAPSSDTDAATKAYVDGVAQGIDHKASVRVATTANLATLSGLLTIDAITVVAGDRVLVKDQSTASANGIYVAASGAWSRAADMDNWDEVPNAFTFVEEGSNNSDTSWVCTSNGGGTLGSTAITFVQFGSASSYNAGAGLALAGNVFSVGTASTSRIVVNADDIDLATTGVSASTYNSVTVDAYGRVTAGTNPTTLAGYGITDAQALDATLTALAGVTTSANTVIYATGSDTFTTTSLTAFGRSLIDDADATAGRSTLGLGTIATQNANNVAITGGTIDGVTLDGGTY